MTPEVTPMLEPRGRLVLEKVRPEAADEWLPRYRALARETGAWLLLGSMAVKVDEERCANRSLLIDPGGAVAARYDKIHMFDVDLGKGRRVLPGVAPLPPGRRGGGRGHALGGADRHDRVLRHALPVALPGPLRRRGRTISPCRPRSPRPTGRAHWHVLLRARAIETGCFVFAPAQCGEHAEGRKTYGHSLIVDPWGEVLADGGEEPGVVMAEIDPARIHKARRMVPSLGHDRPWTPPRKLREHAAD